MVVDQHHLVCSGIKELFYHLVAEFHGQLEGEAVVQAIVGLGDFDAVFHGVIIDLFAKQYNLHLILAELLDVAVVCPFEQLDDIGVVHAAKAAA